MNALIAEYKTSKQTDSKTSYIFLLKDNGVSSKNKDKRDAAGFMPRGKQFGFVFTNSIPVDELNSVIAHELGHGRWRLTHTFDDYGDRMKKSTTDNLMDYANGTHLAKWQWEQINDPAWFTNPFEGDEEAMSHKVKNITTFIEWLKGNLGKNDVPYNKNDFYGGNVVFDHPIKVESLGITLFIEFEKSGSLNLGVSNSGGYPSLGVEFELDKRYHNGFYFKIKYTNSNDEAIKIWFYSYDEFDKFLSYLGLALKENTKEKIKTDYETSIEKAKDDCDKLDVIYETIPDFVIAEIPDNTLIEHLKILASCSMSNSVASILIGKGNDTDEEKAALTILRNIKNKNLLYDELYKSPKTIIDLYNKIGGENSKILSQIFSSICTENWDEDLINKAYNKSNIFFIQPNFTVYGKIENSSIALHGNYFSGSGITTQVHHIPEQSSYHPFAPVYVVFTQEENTTNQQCLSIPAISLLYMADELFWSDVKKGSMNALQLFGMYASTYTYVNATSKLLRTVAVLEVANESTRLLMEKENVRLYLESQPWGADFLTGYVAVSTGVDILSISTGIITALRVHADDVRLVLKNNSSNADELAEYERIINIAKAKSMFKVGDEFAGIPIERVKQGSGGDKIFVIGTDMDNRITPFAKALENQGYRGKIELFSEQYQSTKSFIIDGKSYTWKQIQDDWAEMMRLKYKGKTWVSYDDPNALKNIQGTLMYKANDQFIQRALQEGIIIDIGKTYDSHFYDMEIFNVFK